MVVSLLARTVRRASLLSDRHARLAASSGLVCGISVCAAFHQFSGLFGSSLWARCGAVGALLVLICGGLLALRRGPRIFTPQTRFGLLHLLLAAATLSAPLVLSTSSWFARRLGETVLTPWGTAGLAALFAAVLVGIPLLLTLFLAGTLAEHPSRRRSASTDDETPSTVPGFLAGGAFGAALFTLALGVMLGADGSGILAAILGSLLFLGSQARLFRRVPFLSMWLDTPAPSTLNELPAGAGSTAATAHETVPVASGITAMATLLLAFVSVGGLLAAVPRVLHQLVPATAYLTYASAAWMLLGAALGVAWLSRTVRRGHSVPALWMRLTLLLGVTSAAVLLIFPHLVHRLIWINSNVSQVWLLVPLRSFLPAFLLLPAGLLCGACCAGSIRVVRGVLQSRQVAALGCGISGITFLLVRLLVVPAAGPAAILTAVAMLCGITSLLCLLELRAIPVQSRWARLAIAGLWLFALAAPAWSAGYRPALAARLLFSTNVMLAARNGVPPARLAYLDEARQIALREGMNGTLSVWKFGTSQFQLRESGIPKSVASTDGEIQPQYSAEILQAVVPLVLHEHPHQVLVLGLGAGVPLQACLASPVQQVRCVESDPELIRLTRELRGPAVLATDDERLQITTADPALLLASTDARHDVIISSPDHSSLAPSATQFTREFYQNAARCLSPEGIFCQRFQYVDFGVKPILALADTLQTAFSKVAAIELAPGELLFIATNDPRGFVRPGLLDRAQAPHISDLMRLVGWDWSVLLTLPAYRPESIQEIAAANPWGVNAAANGDFAFRLPPEVIRWAPKLQDVQATLGPRQETIRDWMGAEMASRPELVRRLSEVKGHQELVLNYPDQYWAYRRKVREQVTKHPKSLIRQVNYEVAPGEMDAEDRRRLRYFEVLGEAAKSRLPEDIRRVAAFETPYDPLLSYFSHLEVAELYLRAGHPEPRQELRHRLHAIYYASPHDRSVQNLHEAIDLLLEEPHAMPDATERWDCLNSLLQVMQLRWESRAANPGIPRDMLRDADRSLVVAEKTMKVLASSATEAGVAPEMWEARQAVLERNLVRALRKYRTELVRLVGREKFMRQYVDESLDSSLQSPALSTN